MAKKHNPRFLNLVESIRPLVREITPESVQEALSDSTEFMLLDVREQNEWSKGKIPDALHLPRGILERDAETLISDPHQPLVLYCGGGYRSALAAHSLQNMGYTTVASMTGGYSGWKSAGYKTEKPDAQT